MPWTLDIQYTISNDICSQSYQHRPRILRSACNSISRCYPTHGHSLGEFSRSGRTNVGGDSGNSARAGDQRGRTDALHVLVEHERRQGSTKTPGVNAQRGIHTVGRYHQLDR